jgi:hypothetical protein
VRQLDGSHTFEIAIPRGGVLLLQPGVYDIDSGSEDQPARVAVFEGAAVCRKRRRHRNQNRARSLS